MLWNHNFAYFSMIPMLFLLEILTFLFGIIGNFLKGLLLFVVYVFPSPLSLVCAHSRACLTFATAAARNQTGECSKRFPPVTRKQAPQVICTSCVATVAARYMMYMLLFVRISISHKRHRVVVHGGAAPHDLRENHYFEYLLHSADILDRLPRLQ